MVKSVDHCFLVLKNQMSCFVPTNSPQPKDVQFPFVEDTINQKIVTLKELEPENFGLF